MVNLARFMLKYTVLNLPLPVLYPLLLLRGSCLFKFCLCIVFPLSASSRQGAFPLNLWLLTGVRTDGHSSLASPPPANFCFLFCLIPRTSINVSYSFWRDEITLFLPLYPSCLVGCLASIAFSHEEQLCAVMGMKSDSTVKSVVFAMGWKGELRAGLEQAKTHKHQHQI